jgi:hypothetical protein
MRVPRFENSPIALAVPVRVSYHHAFTVAPEILPSATWIEAPSGVYTNA